MNKEELMNKLQKAIDADYIWDCGGDWMTGENLLGLIQGENLLDLIQEALDYLKEGDE